MKQKKDETVWLPEDWKIPKTILNIQGHWEKGLWWIRVNGYGFHYKNIKLHPPLFSERYGYRKKLKLGRFWFGVLKPPLYRKLTNEELEEAKKLYQRNEFPEITKKKDEKLTIIYEEKPEELK